MIAPSAQTMLLGAPYAGQRLRKLRFLMTDNILSMNAVYHPEPLRTCTPIH
jgi:hypothetical protein